MDDTLPPAHPRFLAHFTHRLYDADDYTNDDVPPFGNDEGSDEVHDWAERTDELRDHPTLRHMLGDEADAMIADLERTPQTDVDDIVIGQGFTLLRFTGQIDPEGRRWLVDALRRQKAGGWDGTEAYTQMLRDLGSFEG